MKGRCEIEPKTLRTRGPRSGPGILCLAGFGDDSSMFEPLLETDLPRDHRVVTVDLPGFGREPVVPGRSATLDGLAEFVLGVAAAERIGILLAHSAASIIAAIVATRSDSPVETVISLEGNLTKEDAYFSGTAADHESPESFREAFLRRLDQRAGEDAVLARYRSRVAGADPHALWVLGNDVFRYSDRTQPGSVLLSVRRAHYLYNPANCPVSSLAWLETSGLPATELPGASHWATLDAPHQVARAVRAALA